MVAFLGVNIEGLRPKGLRVSISYICIPVHVYILMFDSQKGIKKQMKAPTSLSNES